MCRSARLARRVFLACAALAVVATEAAASLRPASDDALARSSAAAVHGRVVALASTWDGEVGAIYTHVTLDVLESWGLPSNPARIVVKQLGGAVGDVALLVGGQARFSAGEEVFVFLDVRPRDRTLSVAGLEQGKWTATAAADPRQAMAREARGADRETVTARDFTSLAALRQLAALTGTRASAADARLSDFSSAAGDDRSGPAFTFLNPNIPARWHQADSGTPVSIDTQAGGHPQFAGGGLTQLAQAAGLWSAAGSLTLAPGVARSARCFDNSEPSDGRISVTYGDPCGEIADGSSQLAIGGAYFSSSDVRVVNGVSFWRMTKGMIVTDNPPAKFAGMSTGCYEDLLAHELGHVLGFGHTGTQPALMYPVLSGACSSRTVSMGLQADELAGMAMIYPRAGGLPPPPPPPPPPPAGPPNPPSGLASQVSGSTVAIGWTPAAGGTAPLGYQLQAGSAPGLANYGAINTAATTLVVPGVPNGVYYVRVLALNAAGASAPTADHAIAVGPTPPGAPRSLSASAGPGGSVALTWLPPASGGAPSHYVVVAGYVPGAATFQFPVGGTSLAGAGVPPATYYVRVVALNAAGVSAASNEVALVVP